MSLYIYPSRRPYRPSSFPMSHVLLLLSCCLPARAIDAQEHRGKCGFSQDRKSYLSQHHVQSWAFRPHATGSRPPRYLEIRGVAQHSPDEETARRSHCGNKKANRNGFAPSSATGIYIASTLAEFLSMAPIGYSPKQNSQRARARALSLETTRCHQGVSPTIAR